MSPKEIDYLSMELITGPARNLERVMDFCFARHLHDCIQLLRPFWSDPKAPLASFLQPWVIGLVIVYIICHQSQESVPDPKEQDHRDR
jgi:hypothetical protein